MDFKEYVDTTETIDKALKALAEDAIQQHPEQAMAIFNDIMEDMEWYDDMIYPIEELNGIPFSKLIEQLDFETISQYTQYYYSNGFDEIIGLEKSEVADRILAVVDYDDLLKIGLKILDTECELPEDLEEYPQAIKILKKYGVA